MSTAAAARVVAATKANQNVSATEKAVVPLFHYVFQPNPKPINCCTFNSTKMFASEPDHPLHIRTQRRLAAFNPNVLHWTVKAPLELSKKAVVRNWAIRRVKAAFREELKRKGWDVEGKPLGGGEGEWKQPLRGALCVHLLKNQSIIVASGEGVKQQCSWLLRKVVAAQARTNGSRGREAENGVKNGTMEQQLGTAG